jgi:HEAT repeat protein
MFFIQGDFMKLENEYASALTDKDKEKAKNAALHILNNKDLAAWGCLVENSEHIFDFIKQKIATVFSDIVDENNYLNLFHLFKIHSSEWDDVLIQIIIRFAYTDKTLTPKMIALLENGSEDEKAYAAKYFSYINEKNVSSQLFKAYQSDYEPLKYNAASALENIGDLYSYEYYITKLESDDDWERIDAAQFLHWYGNKKALFNILQAMNTSVMSEYIAGEAAMLDEIHKYFDESDASLKDLSLECYENILNGLTEIWPMSVLLDFKLYDTVKKLILLVKTSQDKDYMPRYAALLLKTRLVIELFMENEHYRYDEDKIVINELEEIYSLIVCENENFWNGQKELLLSEIAVNNEKRKLFAIATAGDLKLETAKDPLIKIINNNDSTEVVILQALQALNYIGYIDNIENKDLILVNIIDPNLKAVAESLFVS